MRGDHDEKEQTFQCQYIAIKENNACLFRMKQVQTSKSQVTEEMHALFCGQPEFSLSGTEVAAKALFSLLRRKFFIQTGLDASYASSIKSGVNHEEHMPDFVVYK